MKTSKFEIIEKSGHGCLSLSKRFNYAPILSLRKSYITITEPAMRTLNAKVGNDLLFAYSDGELYMAVINGTLNDNGYKIQSTKHKSNQTSAQVVTPAAIKDKIKFGIYAVGSPVFEAPYDWFKLILINQ